MKRASQIVTAAAQFSGGLASTALVLFAIEKASLWAAFIASGLLFGVGLLSLVRRP